MHMLAQSTHVQWRHKLGAVHCAVAMLEASLQRVWNAQTLACTRADDNELCQRLVNPLQHGVRLHAVIDACHSGSALDLPFRCKVDPRILVRCGDLNLLLWLQSRPEVLTDGILCAQLALPLQGEPLLPIPPHSMTGVSYALLCSTCIPTRHWERDETKMSCRTAIAAPRPPATHVRHKHLGRLDEKERLCHFRSRAGCRRGSRSISRGGSGRTRARLAGWPFRSPPPGIGRPPPTPTPCRVRVLGTISASM